MKRHSRIIRIFISSTFADMKLERRLLQQDIIPYLKKHCLKAGWQFEAVDLRWGISEQAAMNQNTIGICLNELERCKMVSPQPNFMILMGQRYGWKPLPEKISGEHFSVISDIAGDKERQLLKEWYLADLNTYQQYHVLQPRKYPYTDPVLYEEQVYQPLNNLFCRFCKTLPKEEQVWYAGSATLQEIHNGALQSNPDQVVSFMRTLDDIPTEEQELYLGNDGNERVLMEQLQQDLKKYMGNNNIIESHINYEQYGNEEYKSFFVSSIKKRLESLIDKEISSYHSLVGDAEEQLNHNFWGKEKQTYFIGRDEELIKLQNAVTMYNRPIWVTGKSGSGKTSFFAKFKSLADEKSWITFERYIGATPDSTNVDILLKGLLTEINNVFPEEKTLSDNSSDSIISDFIKKITSINSPTPVIFLLDGIDQLNPHSEGADFSWIPRRLPDNISIFISCVSNYQYAPKHPFMNLDGLTENMAMEYMEKRLKTDKRTLTKIQWEILKDAITASDKIPSYLSNLFDIISKWTSYEQVNSLPPDDQALIKYRIEKLMLPENHGEQLINMVMGLIACSKHGLTNDELLEILGSDDDFWKYLNKSAFHDIETVSESRRAIPSIYLSRLIHDTNFMLTSFQNIGGVVYNFKHMSFKNYAEDEILVNKKNKSQYYHLLARYFKERWPEPYVRGLEEYPYALINLNECQSLESILTDFRFIQLKSQYDLLQSLHTDYNAAKKICQNPNIETYHNFVTNNTWLFEQYAAYYPEFVLQTASTYRSPEIAAKARRILENKRPILTFLAEKKQNISEISPVFSQKRHDGEVRLLKFLKGERSFISADFHNLLIYDVATGMLQNKFSSEEYINDADADLDNELFVIGIDARNTEFAVMQKFYIDNAHVNNASYKREAGKTDEDFFYDNIIVWNKKNDTILKLTDPGAQSVKRVAITPDAHFILSISDKRIILWESNDYSYEIIRTIENKEVIQKVSRDNECNISSDGRYIICVLNDNIFYIYDMLNEKKVLHLDSGYCQHYKFHPMIFTVKFNPDETGIRMQTNTELVEIKFNATESPIVLYTYPMEENSFIQIPEPDLKQLRRKMYLISYSGAIRVIYNSFYLYNPEGWEDDCLWKTIWDVPGLNGLKTFSSYGKYLLGGDKDGEICLYDINIFLNSATTYMMEDIVDFREIIKFKENVTSNCHTVFGSGFIKEEKQHIEISNKGKRKQLPIRSRGVFPVGKEGIICLGGTIVYFINDELEEKVLLHSKEVITSCTVHPDKKQAIFGNTRGEICIVPIFAGRQRFSSFLIPHNNEINQIALDHSGRYLLSCSKDKFIVISDIVLKKDIFRHYSEKTYQYIYLTENKHILFIDENNDYIAWNAEFDNFDIHPNYNYSANKNKIDLLSVNPFEIKEYQDN